MTVHEATSPLAAPVVLGTVPTVSPRIQFLGFGELRDSTLIGILFPFVSGGHPVLFTDATKANSLVLVSLPTAEWQAESF